MSEDWDNDIGRTPSSFAPIKEETSQVQKINRFLFNIIFLFNQ